MRKFDYIDDSVAPRELEIHRVDPEFGSTLTCKVLISIVINFGMHCTIVQEKSIYQ